MVCWILLARVLKFVGRCAILNSVKGWISILKVERLEIHRNGVQLMPHDDFYNFNFKSESIFTEHFTSFATEDCRGQVKITISKHALKSTLSFLQNIFITFIYKI